MIDGALLRLVAGLPSFGLGAAAQSAGVIMQALGANEFRSGVVPWVSGIVMQQAAKLIDGLGEDSDGLFTDLWEHILHPVY